MMMSSVHHLGDAVLMAPHRAKHARSAAAAWHGNPFWRRDAGVEREARDSGQSRRRRRRSRTPQHVETYAHS